MRTTPFLALALSCAAPSAAAQSLTILLKDGDMVPGVGAVTSTANVAVNAAGSWLAEIDTDHANADADGVVLADYAILLREGDALAAPAGASVGSFDDLSLEPGGRVGHNLFLDGLTTSTDSGVFVDATVVIPEGSISTAAAFTPGTPYIGFFGTKLNIAGQLLIVASIDDPAIATTVDRALVVATVDGAGTLLSESVIAKEGDLLSGVAPDAVTDFGTNANEFAWNDAGQALYTADLTGATTANQALFLGTTLVARKGDVSPFAGRTWDAVGSALDLADNGGHVFRGNLSGATTDDEILVRNGTVKVAQEGDPVTTGSGTWALTSFGTGNVRIADSGEVVWFGDWNDPDTTRDTGLFVDGTLLVQEGVTLVAGLVLQSISGVQDNFDASPDGRFVIFRGTLAGAGDAVVLIDRNATPPIASFCFGDGTTATPCPCGNVGATGKGCDNSIANGGALLVGSGSTSPDTVVLAASDMLPTALHIYLQGSQEIANGSVFGDGVRCAGGQLLRLVSRNAVGGASQFPDPAFGDPSITARSAALGAPIGAGEMRWYQTYYRDPALAFCPNPPGNSWNVTNGVRVQWP